MLSGNDHEHAWDHDIFKSVLEGVLFSPPSLRGPYELSCLGPAVPRTGVYDVEKSLRFGWFQPETDNERWVYRRKYAGGHKFDCMFGPIHSDAAWLRDHSLMKQLLAPLLKEVPAHHAWYGYNDALRNPAALLIVSESRGEAAFLFHTEEEAEAFISALQDRSLI